ncbi:MAG: hypothetical protein Harvfovirus2_5 [Harvfovirus sp.]|uniref:Uncharacterized protein n=1 Tax=Harvfovirus sp. TaxID=2487768 RepID=A0A3G4ZZX2_9VIRU|nr:MAG: hypothetical protein Harvfovirus2_5 [Harvfovirus sp.]
MTSRSNHDLLMKALPNTNERIYVKLTITKGKMGDYLDLNGGNPFRVFITYNSVIAALFEEKLTYDQYVDAFAPLIMKFSKRRPPAESPDRGTREPIDKKTLAVHGILEINSPTYEKIVDYRLFTFSVEHIKISLWLQFIENTFYKLTVIATETTNSKNKFASSHVYEGDVNNFLWDYVIGGSKASWEDYINSIMIDIENCFVILRKLLGDGVAPSRIAKKLPILDELEIKNWTYSTEDILRFEGEETKYKITIGEALILDFGGKLILTIKMDDSMKCGLYERKEHIGLFLDTFMETISAELKLISKFKISKSVPFKSIIPKGHLVFYTLNVESYVENFLKGGVLTCYKQQVSEAGVQYNVHVEIEYISNGVFVMRIVFSDNEKVLTFMELRNDPVRDFICDILVGPLKLGLKHTIETMVAIINKMFRSCDC